MKVVNILDSLFVCERVVTDEVIRSTFAPEVLRREIEGRVAFEFGEAAVRKSTVEVRRSPGRERVRYEVYILSCEELMALRDAEYAKGVDAEHHRRFTEPL